VEGVERRRQVRDLVEAGEGLALEARLVQRRLGSHPGEEILLAVLSDETADEDDAFHAVLLDSTKMLLGMIPLSSIAALTAPLAASLENQPHLMPRRIPQLEDDAAGAGA
jgi:hypothetical protein